MFQISAPAVEASRKTGSGMRARPAGMEISVRTMGISLPTSTMMGPNRRKKPTAMSISSAFMVSSRP
ncbi:hypothetical protein D9M73_288260 [compost metagenome]